MESPALSQVNENARIAALTELDLDYSDLQDNFKNLTRLAANGKMSIKSIPGEGTSFEIMLPQV